MNARMRRALTPGIAVVLVGVLALLAGCETLNLRRQPREAETDVKRLSKPVEETDSTKILDVDSDPAKPSSFFKSSRLGAGLSDESREIESHFGIQ